MTDTSTMAALPEEAEEPVVEQQKMEPSLQSYLKELEKHAFVHDFRIDTHNPIAPQIAAAWPHLQGWEKQEEELLGRIVGVLGKIPSIQNRQDGNMPLIFMRISAGAEKQSPIMKLEPLQSQVVGSWDSEDGTVRSCIIMPAETLPALDHMAVSSGLIMVSQTETAFYDDTKDMRINGYGGGPGIYYGERNKDKQPPANSMPEEPYMPQGPTPSPAQQVMNPTGIPQTHVTPQEESGPANSLLVEKEAAALAMTAGAVAAEEAHRFEEKHNEEVRREEGARRAEILREENLREQKKHAEEVKRDDEKHREDLRLAEAGLFEPFGPPEDISEYALEMRLAQEEQLQQREPGENYDPAIQRAELSREQEISLMAGEIAIAEAEVTNAEYKTEGFDSGQPEPQRPIGTDIESPAETPQSGTGEVSTNADSNASAESAEGVTRAEDDVDEGYNANQGENGAEIATMNTNEEGQPAGVAQEDNENAGNDAGVEPQQEGDELQQESVEPERAEPETQSAEQSESSENNAEPQSAEQPESSENKAESQSAEQPESSENNTEPQSAEQPETAENKTEPQSAEQPESPENKSEPQSAEQSESSSEPQSEQTGSEPNTQNESGENTDISQESEPRQEQESSSENTEQPKAENSQQENQQQQGRQEEPSEPEQNESRQNEPEQDQSEQNDNTRDENNPSDNNENRETSAESRDEDQNPRDADQNQDQTQSNQETQGREEISDRASDNNDARPDDGGQRESRSNSGEGPGNRQNTEGSTTGNQLDNQNNGADLPPTHADLMHSLHEATIHHMIQTSLGHNVAAAHQVATAAHASSMLPPAPTMSGLNARPSVRNLAMAGTSGAVLGVVHAQTPTQTAMGQGANPSPANVTPKRKKAAQALGVKTAVLRAKAPRAKIPSVKAPVNAEQNLLKKKLRVAKQKTQKPAPVQTAAVQIPAAKLEHLTPDD